MHGPFSKILGGPGPPAPRIDAPDDDDSVLSMLNGTANRIGKRHAHLI